jgi:hypothetical protein
MRGLVILAVCAALSGCTHFFPPQTPCPDILSAEAWTDRMPGPEKPVSPLIVSLRLDTGALWMLTAITQEESPAVLQLELQPGGAGYPGSAGFRSTKAGHPDSIEIVCAGKLRHTIRDVMIVS